MKSLYYKNPTKCICVVQKRHCHHLIKKVLTRKRAKTGGSQNQGNVSELGDMSTCRLLFQWASIYKNPTQHVGLEQSGPHHHLIENYLVLDMIELKMCWVLNNNLSLTHSLTHIWLIGELTDLYNFFLVFWAICLNFMF